MSATLGGAIKAMLETQALGVPIFNTNAALIKADGSLQDMPYVVITEALDETPEREGRGQFPRTSELVQVDVYRSKNDRTTFDLAKRVKRALAGAKLPTAPELVFRVGVSNAVDAPDPDERVDRKTITAVVRRRF